jgi:hypothetical protein
MAHARKHGSKAKILTTKLYDFTTYNMAPSRRHGPNGNILPTTLYDVTSYNIAHARKSGQTSKPSPFHERTLHLRIPARCKSRFVSTSLALHRTVGRVQTLPPTHTRTYRLAVKLQVLLTLHSRAPRPNFHPRRNTSNTRQPHPATASVPRTPPPRADVNAARRYMTGRCHDRQLTHIGHTIRYDVTTWRPRTYAHDNQPVRPHDRLLTHIQHTILYDGTTWRLRATANTDEKQKYHIPDYTASQHGDNQSVRRHDRLLTHLQHTILYNVTTWRPRATDHTDENTKISNTRLYGVTHTPNSNGQPHTRQY